jgi:hypothetical protein
MKTDQLVVTCFIISQFTAHRVSNISTSIFMGLRLIVDLFHVLYFLGSMCIDVTVWFGWGGVVSGCRMKHYCFSLHKSRSHLKSSFALHICITSVSNSSLRRRSAPQGHHTVHSGVVTIGHTVPKFKCYRFMTSFFKIISST